MHLTNVFHFRGSLAAVVSQLGNFANSGSSFDAMLFFLGAVGVGSAADSLVGDTFRPLEDGSLLFPAIL